MSNPQIMIIGMICELLKVFESLTASNANQKILLKEIVGVRHQMSLQELIAVALKSAQRTFKLLLRVDEFLNVIAVDEAMQVVSRSRFELKLANFAFEILVEDENVIGEFSF